MRWQYALGATLLLSLCSFRMNGADSSSEMRLYRWVDDNGMVHYADRIPPTQVNQGHTTLNPEGIRTEVVPPAPTAEDLKRAAELERQQAENARRAEEERVANQALLKRFRSLEDLILAREGRVAAVDAINQTTRDNLRLLQRRLRELHQQQASRKPTDSSLPATLQADIVRVEEQIRTAYTTIVTQEFQKVAIRAEFDQLQTRYVALKNNAQPNATLLPPPATEVLASNIVRCFGAENCQRDWERARAYVRALPDIREEINGAGLLMVMQQDDDEDRLLTLVWIQQPADTAVYLYLNLECKNRLTASLLCTNAGALTARDGFRAALMSAN
ncbi:DUF4124 domain-containing protein [Chromatium okenii]|jgi:hypothetical protein|nr:DUF4124 domain-containing protein [Chromatium okenii]